MISCVHEVQTLLDVETNLRRKDLAAAQRKYVFTNPGILRHKLDDLDDEGPKVPIFWNMYREEDRDTSAGVGQRHGTAGGLSCGLECTENANLNIRNKETSCSAFDVTARVSTLAWRWRYRRTPCAVSRAMKF